MSKIKVRLKNGNTVSVKLKPQNGIKTRSSTVYLFDPTLIDGEVQLAQDWAIKTDGLVEEDGVGIDYSSKAYAIGGTGTQTNNSKYYAEQAGISETNASNSATSASGSSSAANSSALLAKDWATKTDGTVDGSDYSAKYYAQQITPIASDITTVAGIASDVTTVANNSANITTVASNTTNINKVASDINRVNLVADDIDSVHTVAVDISTVIDVANNKTNIDTVAGIASDVTAVAGNATNINAVADNETNINAVNANKTNIDAVAGNETNINAVVSNATNINAVASNATNINSVASDATNIDAVAGDLTNIDAVANDLTNIDNASTYANNAHIWAEGSDAQVSDLGGEKSAKGWAARAKEIADGIGSIYKPAGSIAFESLPTLSSDIQGNVYNITNDFTTTSDFVEGAGKSYPAGTNVVCIDTGGGVYKWDVLSGIVDLSGYVPTSRTVNGKALSSDISLTYSDVGAQQAGNYVTTNTVQTITEAKTFTKAVHFTGTGDTNAVFLTENTRFDIEGTTRTILGMGSAQFYINHSSYALLLRGKNARPSYNSATSYLALLSDLDGYVPTTRTVNGKSLSSDISLTASDVGALPDSTVIPTVNDSTITIQKNGTTVDSFTTNASSNKSINITVPTSAADVSALPSSTKYGADLSYSSNTLQLKDQDGNNLGSPVTISGGSSSLATLTDVTLTTPTSGQALLYDGSKWVNGSAGVSATYDSVNERITFA